MHNQILNKSINGPCLKTTLPWSGNLPIQDMPCLHITRRRHMATCATAMQTTHPCAYNKETQQSCLGNTKIIYIKQNINALHTHECKNLQWTTSR